MARIPDATLKRLKNDISLQRLVEGAGITLTPHGKDLLGLCPFHDDKEPSLIITPSKNLWHCLGACQCGGSVIDWVMKKEGVSFKHAVELLLNDYAAQGCASVAGGRTPGATAMQTHKSIKKTTVNKLSHDFTEEDDAALLHQVVTYYHNTLKQTPDALAYLQQRGIDNAEAIEHFKLGFSNRSLGYRLPYKNRKAGAELRGRLIKLGIYRDSGHEHLNGSLVIPVINDNDIKEVYGRKICNRLRAGTPKHLYLPGPHRGVFNLEELKNNNEIILCESLIDALTFWCAGYRNVTCSYGIEGFTKDHEKSFKHYDIERVLIAYDNDDGGNKAAKTLAAKLIKIGIDCYRLVFPKGMDANDYAVKVGPAAKSLGLAIRKAEWLENGTLKVLPSAVDGNKDTSPQTVHDRAQASPQALDDNVQLSPSTVHDSAMLPATPLPAAPNTDDNIIEANDDEIIFQYGPRRYRVRGLKKNPSYDQLKVNVLISKDDALHVDTFDMYQARGRNGFIKQAAMELQCDEGIIKKDLANVLLKLETLQQQHIEEVTAPPPSESVLSKADERDAIQLLQSPNLLQRLLDDYQRCGVVGEETNKLVGYLAAVSRKLDKPLAVLIQSTSAAGKSALMEAVLSFMPEEERIQYSAMTGQSLFYMGETNLKHKILAISEEEGASQAAYALKLLQSEGKLTIASTGKDPDSGKHVTHEYTVEGPVMIFSTTTAIDIDEELLNRCLVLTVDEDRAQTQAIHDWQRYEETLEGLLASQARDDILKVHRNAQRLLKPLKVVNPYAKHLTFLDDKTRTRRDHKKYLTLIRSITLLHQYQREVKTTFYKGKPLPYIEVTLEDIDTANRLAHDVLGRSLDELPPQTRRLLIAIDTMVTEACAQQKIKREDYHFSRRQVREYVGWSDAQVKKHMKRLEEMEYVLVHRGRRGQSFEYELLYAGQGRDGDSFMMRLIAVADLKYKYDPKLDPLKPNKDPLSTPQVTPKSPPSVTDKKHDNDLRKNDLLEIPTFLTKNSDQAPQKKNASYAGQDVPVSRAQGSAGATRKPISAAKH